MDQSKSDRCENYKHVHLVRQAMFSHKSHGNIYLSKLLILLDKFGNVLLVTTTALEKFFFIKFTWAWKLQPWSNKFVSYDGNWNLRREIYAHEMDWTNERAWTTRLTAVNVKTVRTKLVKMHKRCLFPADIIWNQGPRYWFCTSHAGVSRIFYINFRGGGVTLIVHVSP